MSEKAQQLLDRTFWFGVNVIKFLRKLPDNYIDRVPKGQVARSSTSIGSNYEEAQGAVSKRDFTNKIGICFRETRESVYWLRILKELFPEESYKKDLGILITEGIELKKIFSTIKKSSSENPNR
jgi:four helix bundle protein